MINYIKSEMYRTLSSKGIYIFFSFIVGLIIIGNTSMSYFLGYEYTMIENLYSGIKLVNSMDIYCLFYILSFVIIQEYRQNTFKNIISSSLSRGKIYLGKLITVNIVIVAMYFIFILVHIITVLILYKVDKSLSLMNVINFIKHIVYGLPLYIGISSLGCFMVFLFKKDSKVTIVYFISFMFTSNIIVYLSYKCKNPKIAEINNYLISPNLSLLGDMNTTSLQVIRASLVGLGFAIVFGILGYVVFKRQDIK